MSVVVTFYAQGDTALYWKCIQRLREINVDVQELRLCHFMALGQDDFQIVSVWESREDFEVYYEKVEPILEELGITPGGPTIRPLVHQLVSGPNQLSELVSGKVLVSE